MDEAPVYRHVSDIPSWLRLLAAVMCVVLAIAMVLSWSLGEQIELWGQGIGLVAFALVLGPLGQFQIDVLDASVVCSSGGGLFRREFSRLDIAGTRVTRLGYWQRISMNINPFKQRVWSLGVDQALVALEMRDGRTFYIGTDRPDDLIKALGFA